jgi:hypothetical protein
MSARRLIPVTIALAAFAVAFTLWKRFLEIDQCADAGGAFLNGICSREPGEVLGFWRWHPGFLAIVLAPPVVAALGVFAVIRLTFVSEHVPPNTSCMDSSGK